MAKEKTKLEKTAKENSNFIKEKAKKTRVDSKNSSSKVISKNTKNSSKKNPKSNSIKNKQSTQPYNRKHSNKTASDSQVSQKTVNPQNTILEYYDLPYRYNETIIKLLAQTPSVLFVYWDISEEDRKHFIEQYGENFFFDTKPVLVVHNITQNYSFEIEIDDFANCWYLNVGDTKCQYYIELGRRGKNIEMPIPNNYLYITSSNIIESPNNQILFHKQSNVVNFKNIKTGEINSKEITSIPDIQNLGKIYNIFDLYSKLYNDDVMNNPTSGLF